MHPILVTFLRQLQLLEDAAVFVLAGGLGEFNHPTSFTDPPTWITKILWGVDKKNLPPR